MKRKSVTMSQDYNTVTLTVTQTLKFLVELSLGQAPSLVLPLEGILQRNNQQVETSSQHLNSQTKIAKNLSVASRARVEQGLYLGLIADKYWGFLSGINSAWPHEPGLSK
ncbi:hypothetical protein RRG08_009595 [Elysia crispata]|uniref:Uncharacterized protein n=1 Tax=Elysia crispata TaxID=231223 RepID=A0AAE0XTB8_9GAST|nr:hypothetical protein RRG08_009595 [Elysia crispata]